jgi:putative heme iron utilization protein
VSSIASESADRARIRAAYERNPRRMTVQLARELGVPEVEVIRALPAASVSELDATRWEELIRSFELLGDVHVIVTNGSVTLESFGRFGNFSSFGAGADRYFNVQTRSLDMHIRPSTISAVFAVEKPGHMDGVNTLSFQFFHVEGFAAFKVFLTFGGSAPPPQRVEQFNALRTQFARSEQPK